MNLGVLDKEKEREQPGHKSRVQLLRVIYAVKGIDRARHAAMQR